MPSDWNAQLVRLTLFAGSPIDGSGIWQGAFQNEPEIDEHRPREGVRRQAGQIDDAVLEIVTTANRLDWLMTVAAPPPILDAVHYIGEAQQVVQRFSERADPWLASRSDLALLRIAFGLIAVLPTPNRRASYARLQELVPSVRYDAERTREVAYQVNRPVASVAVPGLELNRITKWSSVRLVLANLNVAAGALNTWDDTAQHFVRCECDNSTPAERAEPLEPERLVAIYKELRDLALANLERGEVP